MGMDSLLSPMVALGTALYAVLLVYSLWRRHDLRGGRGWYSLAAVAAMLAAATLLLPTDARALSNLTPGFGLGLALAILLVAFGAVIITDVHRLHRRIKPAWLALGALWLLALFASAFLDPAIVIGQSDWIARAFEAPQISSWALLGGLGVTGGIILLLGLYAYRAAPLPEIANRALFWVLDAVVVLLGILLAVSGLQTLVLVGLLTLFVGLAGMLYGLLAYRVFDIRSAFNLALRGALIVTITALVIYAALLIAASLRIPRASEANVILGLLALGVAVVYVPLRRGIERLISPLLRGRLPDSAGAARRFSQRVTSAFELEALISVVSDTLRETLGISRAGLLLVNDTTSSGGRVELRAMPFGGLADTADRRGFLAQTSPLYHHLVVRQVPVSLFDIEFAPAFRTTPADERAFLGQLHMSAFAPILVENALIGVLACGAKAGDAPYYPRDLELLATLANQTGVALRNARLVADLRHLNSSMTKLNRGLEEANQQMEKLDSVKTDFVTIASHELRTPLAQIRGYTDILDALNDQGMLDPDQTRSMVGNLRKAGERMEELIAAMLDVSQLDVNAMDLRFAPTTAETTLKLAIEPLTDALKQRKLTLSARGLRGLPPIQADMQRLVQAFRNVLINAIKYTPDGGRIEVTASIQPAKGPGESDQILIAIADTGVGIAPENLELIFQKFYRGYDPSLHSTGTYKFMGAGPGLGLTITRGVIEGHGGRIWAESPGHNLENFPGSTFYVLLPVQPPEDARRVMPFEA